MVSLKDLFNKWKKKHEPVKRLASFVSGARGRLAKSFKTYKEVWIGVGAAAVVILVIFISVFSTVERTAPGDAEADEPVVENGGEDAVPRHPLTGEAVDKLVPKPHVFGVMVENAQDAWPLSGLDKAFLVIEAPVEAGIPRFIAFFEEDADVEKIGPVRSARPYYLDWNDELSAVYTHVGGSPEALELIRFEYDTTDLNQFFQSEYFYRQNSTRFAPHNVYTDADRLRNSLNELDSADTDYGVWKFKDPAAIPAEEALSLRVDFREGSLYDIDWQFDPEFNHYVRRQGGSLMRLENGFGVTANNVVVISTDIRTIDREGRKHITTVGEGDALIAQDGEVFLARWRKDGRTSRLRFFTSDGFEISMNPGSTWIEIVSTLNQAQTYTKTGL